MKSSLSLIGGVIYLLLTIILWLFGIPVFNNECDGAPAPKYKEIKSEKNNLVGQWKVCWGQGDKVVYSWKMLFDKSGAYECKNNSNIVCYMGEWKYQEIKDKSGEVEYLLTINEWSCTEENGELKISIYATKMTFIFKLDQKNSIINKNKNKNNDNKYITCIKGKIIKGCDGPVDMPIMLVK